MSLRQDFASLLDKYGHWVILRKAMLDKRCRCWDSSTNEPDESCTRCNGSGYPFVDHLVLARKTKLTDSPETTSDIGKLAAPRWHFYLMRNTNPIAVDWILEIALDPATKEPIRPITIEKYYDIQDIEVMRVEAGEIIYYDCQVEESVWNVLT